MVLKHWAGVFALCAVLVSVLPAGAQAQGGVDTLRLVPATPDSFYLRRAGGDLVIGWYPPHDSVGSLIGSRDFTNWYGEHGTAGGVRVTFTGHYTGRIDRTIRVTKLDRVSYVVGADPDIRLRIETVDMFDRTYERLINLGADSYTPGDPIPGILRRIGAERPDTLFLGFDLHFSAGRIDTSIFGPAASFELDLQTYEGYHIWRGVTPYPSEMQAIVELSREDYHRVSIFDAIEDVPVKWRWLWEYFRDHLEPAWPRRDAHGRRYYEWIDRNVFAGITYYYVVTTYDRGYFKGFFLHNKKDSFICDEDPDNPAVPGEPVLCEDAAIHFEMTVDTGTDMRRVFAVPNPYRTGTSAETTPYYHNYPDGAIRFFNMPREATIKIYTVAGDLVWEETHSSPDGSDGIISWNVRNRQGQEVGSGVYVFRVERPDGEDVYGRIVVIR